MATQTISDEREGMEAFCAAMLRNAATAEALERLCAVGQYRALPRGGELRSGRQQGRLVFVIKGAAKLLARPAIGRRARERRGSDEGPETHILSFHFADDIVSIPQDDTDNFRLAALTDLELVVFFANQFLDVAQTDPAIIRTVMARSAEALDRSRARMIALGHKSARQRIAGFLVSMAQRVCGSTTGHCEFALPMSRTDIGDSLGLTIETVSRQFAELRGAALIETFGRRGLRVPSLDRLAREARCN